MNGLGNVGRIGRAVQLLAVAVLLAWPLPVLAQNAAPTGAPVITAGDEPLAVGRTLSVDTSGIMDADGLSNPGFTYQWLADDAEISGATGSTYDLTAAEAGKVIKVRVSFTDDGGAQETLTGLLPPRLVVKAERSPLWVYRDDSVEYDVALPAVVTEALVVSVASSDADVTVSPSSLTFAAASWNTAQRVTVTAAAEADKGSATLTHTAAGVAPVEVTLTVAGEIRLVGSGQHQGRLDIWLGGDWGTICYHGFEPTDAEVACRELGYSDYRAYGVIPLDTPVGNGPLIYSPNCTGTENGLVDCPYTDHDQADNYCFASVVVELACSNPATGTLTISGTFAVGETLTADISGIMDPDGLSNPRFTYQWLADGRAIFGATRSTYLLTEAEQGKHISVRVGFTDDTDDSETFTSAAGGPLPSPPVGAPVIIAGDETLAVGRTLWVDTSEIMDADGLSNPGFTYQWLADDAEISGATGSTYDLTAAEAGKVIKVQVSFTDDGGAQETLTGLLPPRIVVKAEQRWVYRGDSVEYDVVLPAVVTEALTVSVTSSDADVTVSPSSLTFAAASWNSAQRVTVAPAADAGKGRVTLMHRAGTLAQVELALTVGEKGELRLVGSRERRGRLDMWLEGRWGSMCYHGFTRTDGDVACRELGYSAYKEHHVPGPHHFLTPLVDSARCTGTEDRLVDCPGAYVVDVRPCFIIVELACSNVTGAPTVSGTFEVGETLSANISGIMDPDGLSDPRFTYQWLADGRAISGATSSTYMLTEAEQGKRISIRVSFTDGGGESETVTSAAGGPVPLIPQVIVEAATPLQVEEGGSVAYTVALGTEPTASVTVTVSSSDTDVTVSPSSLTFTTGSWSTAQTVTVSAGQDEDAGNESVTLTHAASGADYGLVAAVEVALTVLDDEVRPGQPTSLRASVDRRNEIDLAWTAPADNVAAPVTGYLIEVSEDAGLNWTEVKADTGSTRTTYVHTDLTGGTTYHYRVTAISARGNGIVSAEASATAVGDFACGRSQKVRDEIVRQAGVDSCSEVTATHLASMTKLRLPWGGTAVPLKAGDFAGMSLAKLWLERNGLSSLPDGIFEGLTSLDTLDLSHNNLGSLPDGVFDGVTRLHWLYLYDNDLGSLPDGIFQNLEDLSYLYLHDNDLASLPDGIFQNLPSLGHLDLRRNNLGSLPDGVFQGLRHLSYLRIGGQGSSNANMSVPIRLEKVGEDRFKAVAPTGAPFSINVPISGALVEGGGTSMTIPAGSLESASARIWSLTGATAGVAVGSPLPALPELHEGYDLDESADAVEVSATGEWSVAISPAAITEAGTGAATVTVDAGEHLSSQSHTFALEIGGTADAGVDYTLTDSGGNELSSPYTMTLPGGSRSVTTTVTAVDDEIEESGETIEVTLRLRGSFVARQTIAIADNDAGKPAQVTITVPDETLEEGADAVFTLTRSGLATAALTVSVDVAGGDGFVPAGNLGAGTVTFGAGVATATMTVATLDDDRKEHRGTITATVGSGDGYVAHATRGSANVVVVDNDWRLMITMPSLELTAEEGPATRPIYEDQLRHAYFSAFAYGRTRLGTNPITLNEGDVEFYLTLAETATEADLGIPNHGAPVSILFEWRGYQETYGVGYQEQDDGTWLVDEIQFFGEAKYDNLVEGDETFIIHIEAKRGGIWLPQAADGRHLRIRGTIKDTDTADWSLSLAPVEIAEGRAETGTVTVSVSKAHERAQTATLELSGAAVEGTDYTIGSRSLTLAPRERSVQTEIASLYNGEDSNDKTVIVTAKRDGGEVIGTQTLTIRNNDTRPGAPAGLSAGADGADRIDLSWTAPEDAGGLPVTGYLIEVSEDAGNNWRDVVEDTGSTETTYAHTGLTGGSTYRYRVSANSAAGPGVPSAEVSATTAVDVACGRSEGVREAMVAAAGVEGCGKVTAAQVAGITELEVDFEPLVLKAGDFAGLTSLVTLRLDGNRLSALPPGIFAGLTSLTALRLDGNELSALPPGIFTGLTGLTTLDLRNNPNTPLPVAVFLEKVGEDGIKAVASTGRRSG